VTATEQHRTLERRKTNQRDLELAKLDVIEETLVTGLMRPRPIVVGGKVVMDPHTGEPLVERGPNLEVIDRLLRLANRRAMVQGSDAPRRREAIELTEELFLAAAAQLEAEIAAMPGGLKGEELELELKRIGREQEQERERLREKQRSRLVADG
jgi:hypothetical protein